VYDTVDEYLTKHGDSINSIGIKHNISTKLIRSVNPHIGDVLYADQVILIPVGLKKEIKKDSAAEDYVVIDDKNFDDINEHFEEDKDASKKETKCDDFEVLEHGSVPLSSFTNFREAPAIKKYNTIAAPNIHSTEQIHQSFKSIEKKFALLTQNFATEHEKLTGPKQKAGIL